METDDRTELTVSQAAEVLNVSDAFVLRLFDEGRIPCRVDGAARFIREAELLAYQQADNAARGAVLDELTTKA